MSATIQPDAMLETRLLNELARIDHDIRNLQSERASVERLLLKVRRENIARIGVTRKNSAGRLLIEKAILDRLKVQTKPIKTEKLLRDVRSIDPTVKDATFRSYLHRLKARGAIEDVQSMHGYWRMPTQIT
jgi:hypothetical protein